MSSLLPRGDATTQVHTERVGGGYLDLRALALRVEIGCLATASHEVARRSEHRSVSWIRRLRRRSKREAGSDRRLRSSPSSASAGSVASRQVGDLKPLGELLAHSEPRVRHFSASLQGKSSRARGTRGRILVGLLTSDRKLKAS